MARIVCRQINSFENNYCFMLRFYLLALGRKKEMSLSLTILNNAVMTMIFLQTSLKGGLWCVFEYRSWKIYVWNLEVAFKEFTKCNINSLTLKCKNLLAKFCCFLSLISSLIVKEKTSGYAFHVSFLKLAYRTGTCYCSRGFGLVQRQQMI